MSPEYADRISGQEGSISPSDFPKVVGFCSQDKLSFIETDGNQSCDYVLDRLIYRLTKKDNSSWVVEEFDKEGRVVAYSFGKNRELTLFHALHNSYLEKDFTNVTLFAKDEESAAKITRVMALFGYPGSLTSPGEPSVPGFRSLTYHKIPNKYKPILRLALNF